jgi:Dihydroorotase and related cyclic amidohydrolases
MGPSSIHGGSSRLDSVIRGADVVSHSVVGAYDIGIRDGRIACLVARGEPVDAQTEVDLSGLTVMPGIVDSHVHFREPGNEHRETFLSGSRAAAAGGVTTVLEMPTSTPTVVSASILKDRVDALSGRSVVDFALFAGAGIGNVHELEAMARAGAVGFKTFLHSAPAGREDSIGLISAPRVADLLRVLEASAATGLVHALHCEEDSLLDLFDSRNADQTVPFGTRHSLSRPPLAEDLATSTATLIGREVAARLHIVHVSSPGSVEIIDRARALGLDITAEVSPHHLLFNDSVLFEHGPWVRCNPPLRSEKLRADLVRSLGASVVDIVASDHCPYTEDEIESGRHDLATAPAGLPGIEFMLPSMLTLVERGQLTLERVVDALTWRPARRFGLGAKGDFAAGFDADFVAFDPTLEWTYGGGRYFSKGVPAARYLENVHFSGAVHSTWLRGSAVYSDGEVVGHAGSGAWLPGARWQD